MTLTGVTVVASYQGLFTNEVSGTLIAYVDHCKIEGATYAIQGGNGEIWIGASQLAVGSVSGAGVTCAGVYDGSYTFYAGCP